MEHLHMLDEKIDHRYLIGQGHQWTDQSFPPTHTSMYQGDAVADLFPDEVETLNNTEFKRLSQVFRNLAVFNDINPDDISQG